MERWKLYKREGVESGEKGEVKREKCGGDLRVEFYFWGEGRGEEKRVRLLDMYICMCLSAFLLCVCVKEVPMYLFFFIYFFNGSKIELV